MPASANGTGRPLLGEVAIVTGASSGIGAATARELGRRGASTVLAARREERLNAEAQAIRSAGGEALAIPTDIADALQVSALVERTVEAFGRVDVVLELAHLVVEVGERTFDVRVLEADGPCALLHLSRMQERRQRLGNVVEHALAPFLLALDAIPVLLDRPGVSASTSPNTCGCRRTSLS